MRLNCVRLATLLALTIVFVLPGGSRVLGQLNNKSSTAAEVEGVPIFEADGSRAENCFLLSVERNKRIKVLNSFEGGKLTTSDFVLAGGVRPMEADSETAFRSPNGTIRKSLETYAHLVVSSDGEQACFVPFDYQGNVQLRPCGKLKFDPSKLPAGDTYIVIVTWKNNMAGRYATCGNQVPGDPQDPNLDWRFRDFITVFSVLTSEDLENAGKEISLPAGEVSVAVIGDKQSELMGEFWTDSATSKSILDWKHLDWTWYPATSGIHRILPGETTQVQLQAGVCLTGKIKRDSTGLPDWNDLGFVDAQLSVSDSVGAWSSWIPGYDLSKGVNHYYEIFQSDVGRRVRERSLANGPVILKTDGRFLTFPLPSGEYTAHLYRTGETKKFPASSGGLSINPIKKSREPSVVGVPLTPLSSDDTSSESAGQRSLSKSLSAISLGNMPKAVENLNSAKEHFLRLPEYPAPKVQLEEVQSLIDQRSELDRLYLGHHPNYNERAREHLCRLAEALIELGDFHTPESLLSHASEFPSKNLADREFLSQLVDDLQRKRTQVLLGEKNSGYVQQLFVVDPTMDLIHDVGEFEAKFSRDEQAQTYDHANYNPLQVLRTVKHSTVRDVASTQKPVAPASSDQAADAKALSQLNQESPEYAALVKDLRTKLETEFDEKLQARRTELDQLQQKVKTTLTKLEERKADREQIIQRRLKSILRKSGQQSAGSSTTPKY